MVQIFISVKNTFVHVDVGTPDFVEKGCNARRRASSAPARVTLYKAEKEKSNTHAFGNNGVEELLLLPHDVDDYSSMHAHPGPSPLDMDVEGMLGCHVPGTDIDDCCGSSLSLAEDETTPEFVSLGMDIYDTANEDYSASAPAHQGLTYETQMPSDSHRENLTQSSSCMSAAPTSPHQPGQRQLFSTVPILPREAQRDSADFVQFGSEIHDAARRGYSASTFAHQDLTYGAQLPSDTYRENPGQSSPYMSAAPLTPYQFSTFTTLPPPAQRDSYIQPHSGHSLARERRNAKHEETQGEETRTTVMMMNLPLRYTSSRLMRTIDSEGFAGMYDFIYVPMTRARNSKGYAFVNLVRPSIAQRFLNVFHGFSSWSTTSTNVGRAVWAKQQQGLQTNIDHFRNSTVLAKSVPDEYKPRIFNNGVELPFPPPTRKPPNSISTRRDEEPRKSKNSQRTLSL